MGKKLLETIRYMGNKSKLIDFIIPKITKITDQGGIICDLMAGTNSISYALKENYTLYTNDIQEYSFMISKAIIENQNETINKEGAIKELDKYIEENKKKSYYNFFISEYADTYFSKEQCEDIDSIRYAISKVKNEYRQALYFLALMNTMSKLQSTTGHYAQYMPSNHKRIIPLQQISLQKKFYSITEKYSKIVKSIYNNKSFCMDYKKLLELEEIKKIQTIYLDSPYTAEQYSRFYHLLETLVKYDYPKLTNKARYRDGRFKSDFCYANKVKEEFTYIFNFARDNLINIVVSYSTTGIMNYEELLKLCKNYFNKVELDILPYKHSTLGKGNQEKKEIVITCIN